MTIPHALWRLAAGVSGPIVVAGSLLAAVSPCRSAVAPGRCLATVAPGAEAAAASAASRWSLPWWPVPALAPNGPPRTRRPPPGIPPDLAGLPFDEVEVRLVLLHATVLDRRGQTVDALGPDDFSLAQDGVPQTISVFGTAHDQPLRIAFLLDVSGSMGVRGKLDRARDAIRRFVAALRPADEVGLLIFADGDVVVEVGFTTDRARFLARLDRQEAYGRTALRDALATAPRLLAEARPGRKALFLVTDGIDNASTMTTFTAVRLAHQVQVPIYVLGLTDLPLKLRADALPDGGRTFFEVLEAFAAETGGEMFPAFAPEEMDRAVERIERRLRAQYVIGYRPAGDDGGPGFRRIELLTADRRHQVLTRHGYYVEP